MSGGGPPHHPHGRQAPSPNTAWNHLQVPNYYPRQPQHAHMSNDHPLLHQSTWHTPTTEPVKSLTHSHLFNLEQMITADRPYPRHSPGVDLSLQRNGSQNGEVRTTPISLSVRDANKINSLPASAIDLQAVELTKSASPNLKPVSSPGIKTVMTPMKPSSPLLKTAPPTSPTVHAKPPASPSISTTSDSPKSLKRPTKKMDSIIERLNPMDKMDKNINKITDKPQENPVQNSVIVQPTSDENSNTAPTSTSTRDEDVISPFSNEDSMDSNKSRRKRKPAKTMRVSKEFEKQAADVVDFANSMVKPKEEPQTDHEEEEVEQRRRSGSAPPGSPTPPPRGRRKTSSESETIANITAMIQKTAPPAPTSPTGGEIESPPESRSISVSVIKTSEDTTAVKNSFVEVENKLEEMFAGISDCDPEPPKEAYNADDYNDDSKILESTENKGVGDAVTSTSSEPNAQKPGRSKNRKSSGSSEHALTDTSLKKKKGSRKSKSSSSSSAEVKAKPSTSKKTKGKNCTIVKPPAKDLYAYDSGSNASSSRSRGPFVQIRGTRESPLSVSIVNAPAHDDDSDRRSSKGKKYHDDTEYAHKVRSRGLHSSTLSNKYDAQTRDATWICVFCKRGPHVSNVSGPSRFDANSSIGPAGDLYGPYMISANSPEYQKLIEDPFDCQFKSKRAGVGKMKRKYSSSHDSDNTDMYLGITETKSGVYEVWAHEDCVVWSPGVYLVGPKIMGLEEAVWTSCNVFCNKCRYKGANLCCIKRGCTNVMHLGCANADDWDLDEENYKALCTMHKIE